MVLHGIVLALALASAEQGKPSNGWVAVISRDGNFVIDFPTKPTKSFTRTSRSRAGQSKVTVVQCDTPEVLYTVQKIELPPLQEKLKAADYQAILDSFRDDLANELNGKVVTQKKLRLGVGTYGTDFTIEGRPTNKGGLTTIRAREYLSQKVLYMMFATTAPDRELPEDVGHFFASFTPGTKRTKKVGPLPEVDGKPLGKWGAAIDPDGDCKIDDKGSALEMSLPNTHHDLNAGNNKLNSPRVMREVTGDFTITVRVTGAFEPGTKSTNPKAVPYIGGGIVVWQDSDNYIMLGRAGINRNNKANEFAVFEEREWGTRAAVNNDGISPGGVFLRIERRNNRILGYTSKDGKIWKKLDPMETSYPAAIKVGLYAINGCTDPVSMRFDNFQFTEGRGSARTKARGR